MEIYIKIGENLVRKLIFLRLKIKSINFEKKRRKNWSKINKLKWSKKIDIFKYKNKKEKCLKNLFKINKLVQKWGAF